MPAATSSQYKAIEDYAVIGNLRTVALVGIDGSIDWCCLPELDRPSTFAAILDDSKGGRFRVSPTGYQSSEQHYLDDTNVLVTSFRTDTGEVRVTDFMPLHSSIVDAEDPHTTPTIHRLIECEGGETEIEIVWEPRFDYARSDMRIELGSGRAVAQGGGESAILAGPYLEDASIEERNGPSLVLKLRLRPGEKMPLLMRFGARRARISVERTEEVLARTVRSWRGWIDSRTDDGQLEGFEPEWRPFITRSELALKLLTHPDTGAVAAAPTTSLPEEIGGVRNWDYRYSWIRDASFTAQALFSLGHRPEALDFLEWTERVAMSGSDGELELQIMYGLHGETELPETTLDHLEGYRGSSPVRIGNGAAKQQQHDIYGELMMAAHEYVRHGGSLEESMAGFLSRVADTACNSWREMDAGIWEVRGGPRHFVYSKVMCWVALDRAITLARRHGLEGDVGRWEREREAIREQVLEKGYDEEREAFVQSYGSKDLDASNLLIPMVGFLPFDDPRVENTLDRTLEELVDQGVVYRYRSDDGLPGGEGAFGLTTFWLIDALTLAGRRDKALELFGRMITRANHVGLYAEEFDPGSGAFLGNFPQGFTHVGQVNSALYLSRSKGRRAPAPAPVGTREHGEELEHDSRAAV